MTTPPTPASAPERSSVAWPEYVALAAVWLATRALAIVSIDMTPWMLHDLEVYQSWLPRLQHLAFPTGDPTWQYPPGASLVFLSSSVLGMDFRWSFTLVILLVDAAILATLLVAHARQTSVSWRGPWTWALAALIVGPIMMTRFDVAPTLFAVLAIVLVARPAVSGAAAAIGAVVKVWPALMLLALPRRRAGRGVLSFILVATAVVIGFALVFDDSLSFLGNQRDRGLQVESTGALPYLLFSLVGGHVEFGLQYGSIQVLMSGAEAVGTVVTVIGLMLLALVAWWRWRGRLDDALPGDVALTVMLVSVATSRVYSPQFNTWLVGLAAVAMLAARTRLTRPALLVIGVSLMTQVVYPWSATQLVEGGAFVITVQSARILLLLVAMVLGLRAIAGAPRRKGP
jgi:hypothetical protein